MLLGIKGSSRFDVAKIFAFFHGEAKVFFTEGKEIGGVLQGQIPEHTFWDDGWNAVSNGLARVGAVRLPG